MANDPKKHDEPGKGDHNHNNHNVNGNNDNVNDNSDDANIADPGISDNLALCMAIMAHAQVNLDGRWDGIAAEFGVSEDFAKQRMENIQEAYLDAIKDYVPPPVVTLKRNRGEKSANPSPRIMRGIDVPEDDTDSTTAGMVSSAPTRPRHGVARKMPAVQQTAIREPQDGGDIVPLTQRRAIKRAKTQNKPEEEEENLYD
ncbi:hypothetical protein PG996_005126 [Apiospora saccharicola]|uniref:Uncharacterized protein n=1 Tax=Apiospora saccharicola TaxID=335842 RepID=A0ABR1VPL1_9PEZI